LLLANSAHEVRTPLNAIINYLEIALEGALDQETRDNLSKSHSASKSLIYVINDLLDLTNTEEGQALIKDEVFDLLATIREATDSFKGDAKRKGLAYELVEHPGVPNFVLGDQRRVRQVIANVTANAVQHTKEGCIRIEVWLQDVTENTATVEIIVQDTGIGMSNELLDSLFRDLEQVSTEGEEDQPFNPESGPQGKETKTLGLGLAMVARTVRNMDGQLRLKSEEGKGSRFVMQLPFSLPDNDPSEIETGDTNQTPAPTLPLAVTTPPTVSDIKGEVTLVAKSSSLRLAEQGVHRKRSLEEVSLHSFKSGSSNHSNKSNASKKSDVDRLIDAISGPLEIGEVEPEEQALQRTTSRGSGHSRKSASSVGSTPVRSSTSIIDRPGKLSRSKSYGAPEHLRRSYEGPPGSEFVTDNKTLLKAVRMPEEFESPATPHVASKVLFEIPDKDTDNAPAPPPKKHDAEHLQVLVAEDDPVNSRIILKRLEKSGHEVHHTVNGEDCASAYGEKPAFFDVVLMDMQVRLPSQHGALGLRGLETPAAHFSRLLRGRY